MFKRVKIETNGQEISAEGVSYLREDHGGEGESKEFGQRENP